ncbi:Hypothetical protein, putative [Bodo saltans]|uniref:Membrane-associated protein n=1 Tax=Bodo saltans TaxID=75058 RepID=A0A0S4JC77_BODSA|nr:Hypothetical protein, putative [Bodo saltans]|eukprot:CUG87093.1 Hypothetical protein, putative [Bodo saltans]
MSRAVYLAVALLLCATAVVAQRHQHPHPGEEDDSPRPIHGDEQELIKTLECPVCDYTAAFVFRKILTRELYCRTFTPEDLPVNVSLKRVSQCDVTPIRNGFPPDEKRLHISHDYAFEALLDACGYDVLESFPATEVMYPKDSEAKRREVYNQKSANPTPNRFHHNIRDACSTSMPRRTLSPSANAFTEGVKGIRLEDSTLAQVERIRQLTEQKQSQKSLEQEDYLSLLSFQDREMIFRALLVQVVAVTPSHTPHQGAGSLEGGGARRPKLHKPVAQAVRLVDWKLLPLRMRKK